MSVDVPELQYRRAAIEEIVDLRHVILRAGLPRETAVFTGDDAGTSRHYGAFENRKAVCCVSLHASQWESQPAWQLRGMATAAGLQRRGIGWALLDWMEAELISDRATPRLLWCNARVPAVGFYEKRGWKVVSEQFDIPTAGPHVRMTKQLSK